MVTVVHPVYTLATISRILFLERNYVRYASLLNNCFLFRNKFFTVF